MGENQRFILKIDFKIYLINKLHNNPEQLKCIFQFAF